MFNDSLVFKEYQEIIATQIAPAFKDVNIGNGLVIAIWGFPGTGKSEVAWWLARKLYRMNMTSHVLSMDRFYQIPVEARDAWRKDTGKIGAEEIDWKEIADEVVLFKSLNKIDVLIIEGLYAGFVAAQNLGVYIHGTMEDTYKFRKLRRKEDPDAEWRKEIVRKECDVVRGTIRCAKEIYDLNGRSLAMEEVVT